MATEVNLPALGESVTEGTVTRWLKQVGDEVAVDEPLLEVSTDKVDTEIPSPVAGTLLEIKAQEDDTVEVGAILGWWATRARAAAIRPGIRQSDSSDESGGESQTSPSRRSREVRRQEDARAREGARARAGARGQEQQRRRQLRRQQQRPAMAAGRRLRRRDHVGDAAGPR